MPGLLPVQQLTPWQLRVEAMVQLVTVRLRELVNFNIDRLRKKERGSRKVPRSKFRQLRDLRRPGSSSNKHTNRLSATIADVIAGGLFLN